MKIQFVPRVQLQEESMGVLRPALVGTTYEAHTFKVDADRVRAYAFATNDEREEYIDETRPGGIIAPPLFSVIPELRLLSLIAAELALPMQRVLHGQQDMTFSSPIRPGDVLLTDASIVNVSETSTGETLSVELVTRADGGSERSRSLTTLYIRDPEKKGQRRHPEALERDEPLAKSTMTVRGDQPAVYADASGDHNLPHTSLEFARKAGFRTVILQGLCTMAFTSKALIDGVCAGIPTELARLKVRFSDVVYPADSLTTSIWGQDGHYAFETTNQHGVAVIKAGEAEIASE